MKDLWLAISPETGTLLYMLARSSGARIIIEFGTSFGISTLYLAAALRDNGGGRLITTEFEPSKVMRAKANLTEGGLIDLVEVREGDALQTLSADLPETIDLLLLDGAKAIYPEILQPGRKPACGQARWSSPTMPISLPNICSECARRHRATCPRRSARTSNCPCGSAERSHRRIRSTTRLNSMSLQGGRRRLRQPTRNLRAFDDSRASMRR